MSTKTLFIAVATVATMITGCESLDKSALASAGPAAASAAGRRDRNAQTAVAVGATAATVAKASNRQSSQSTQTAERERSAPAQISSTSRSNVRTEEIRGAVAQTQVPQQVQPETAQTSTEKQAEEIKAKSVDIVEISDDQEFVEALKKEVDKKKDEAWLKKAFNRASEIKDQTLLLELIGLYPDLANVLAGKSSFFLKIRNPQLAGVLINVQAPKSWSNLEWSHFKTQIPPLAMQLDEKAKAQYLARAKENREKAAKDGVLIADKFYIGMPVIDYVILSREDGQAWTKIKDPYDESAEKWLRDRVDKNTDVNGQDWRTEWKIADLTFDPKSRHKYFKVKGTREGLLEFAKKYCDKSATYNDITIDGNWWQYTDDEHGVKVFLNDNSGFLNITSL